MSRVFSTIAVVLLALTITVTEAGDTEIWPIPTECPAVDPLEYTVHLQHESDCTKFYKCDHGEKVLFDCPPGLEFSPVLQVCVWPQDSGCTLGQGSSEPPTPEPTTPEPTTPEPTTAEPTTPEPTTPEPTTPEPTTPEPTTQEPTTPEPTTTPKPTPPPNKDPECPWPDPLNYTVHLPHETDCTKFYKCDNGIKVEFDCPDGLHFNKELEVCDWPRDAGCEETTPAPTTPEPTTTPKPTPPPNRDPECPWPDPLDHTVHLPHETDCTKFYKCDNGVKVEFDCPDGLHFNKELEVCDWPKDAGCEETTPAPTTPEPTTTPKPTPPPNKDPECPWPDPLNYTVHLPHETDCTKFYKCDNGVKVEFDCPDGLHFNKELEVCDWPRDAGCEETTPAPTTPEPTTTPKPTPPPNRDPECPWPDPLDHTVHLPHETDCTKFYKCDNGVKVEFDCPAGLHFNKELEVCDWPQNAGCEETTPAPTTPEPTTPKPTPPPNRDPECPWPDPLNYTVHLPHETDCTKFYKCDNGVKVEFDCPAGLHFNKELEVCDWPQNAGCEETTPAPTTPEPTTSPKPTPPPNKDPECPWPDPLDHTVHLPHETDCSKFYKCDNGVKVEFDCPAGLHFNKELEVCDWPWNAGCEETTPAPTTPEPTTSPKPTPPPNKDPECPWPDPLDHTVHLPHETDCTKFYKCDNGVKVEFDCPAGLHFNKELEVCDWPWDAGCEEITPTPTTPKPTSTPEPTPPPNRDPECPWPDPLNYTVHLPHETDCTKFYKCDNGVKVEFDCPDGLHFNKELEVCDWPQDAGCEETTLAPTTPEPTTTSKPTPPPNKDPECPWPDPLDHTVHLPHETDCTKFYKCDNGVKVEFDCPAGLHFNKELQVCDWPWNAGCEETTPAPTTPEPTTTPKPTPPPNRDPECPWPDPLDHTVHLPHETDCTKFYKCDNGVKVEFDCPAGLHFNKDLEVCDWPWNAGCEETTPVPTTPKPTSTPEPTPPPNRDPECPWPDPLNYTVHLPHETDCTKFYKCDNGVKVEFDCPAGLHFNKELEVCDWPKDAGCEETTTAPTTPEPTTPKPTPPPNRDPECPWPDPLNYTVHLPHETDCTKFYKCDNGVKVEFDCPDGLHFNKELEVCDWPWDAGCEETTLAPTTPEPTTPPKPTPPPNRDPECPWPDPLNYTVHLPHETDCTKFYKCDNGVKVEFDCPDGLHFNKELEVCDWPQDAGCEETTPAPTTPEPTTTPKPTPPPNRDPDCPWPDPLNYTVHLPHETDCTKFYKCDNGVKVEFDCPAGLHFNKELEVCDWPQDAGCEETTPAPTTPEPTTTPKPTPPPNRDPDCPWPDPLNYTVHLPHETDCDKFYKCDNGVKVEFECPDGLHFNPELEVCDWPWEAGCEDPTTVEPTTPECTEETETTPEPTTPEPTPPCPNVNCQDATIYLPYLANPRQYIRCVNGEEVVETCPGPLVFDSRLATCNLEHLIVPVR